MARVARFRRAERLLRAPAHRSIAAVALTCGYYDQAHLNRDFRELAGCPPTAHLAELHADAAAAGMTTTWPLGIPRATTSQPAEPAQMSKTQPAQRF